MRNEILELKTYYQEFHHKCLSWHITVMGFFIAGAIAAGSPATESSSVIGWSIIIFTSLTSVLFFLCMFHYSKRIEVLGTFLVPDASIPENWHDQSTKVGIAVHGVGSWFFLSLMVLLQVAVICLSTIQFLC